MYSDNNIHGDSGSVGEELLINISDLEQKVMVVDKAVEEGYFTLDDALPLYGLTAREYVAYLFLKNKSTPDTQQHQLSEMLSLIVKVYHGISNQFDPRGKKMMHELETVAKGLS